MDGKVCVGAVAGAYGVQGEVRFKSFCADPWAMAEYGPLSDEAGRTYQVQLDRAGNGVLIGRLSDVRSKEDADALKGVRLYADRSALPETEEDEYYFSDLIGLTVVDPAGETLGTVKAVHNHGAADLLEIARPGGGETALLPFTNAAVPTVDLGAGRIIADPPEGVF
ncbi:MAG: ribosome maturation factor RimM [Shimia sp.]